MEQTTNINTAENTKSLDNIDLLSNDRNTKLNGKEFKTCKDYDSNKNKIYEYTIKSDNTSINQVKNALVSNINNKWVAVKVGNLEIFRSPTDVSKNIKWSWTPPLKWEKIFLKLIKEWNFDSNSLIVEITKPNHQDDKKIIIKSKNWNKVELDFNSQFDWWKKWWNMVLLLDYDPWSRWERYYDWIKEVINNDWKIIYLSFNNWKAQVHWNYLVTFNKHWINLIDKNWNMIKTPMKNYVMKDTIYKDLHKDSFFMNSEWKKFLLWLDGKFNEVPISYEEIKPDSSELNIHDKNNFEFAWKIIPKRSVKYYVDYWQESTTYELYLIDWSSIVIDYDWKIKINKPSKNLEDSWSQSHNSDSPHISILWVKALETYSWSSHMIKFYN